MEIEIIDCKELIKEHYMEFIFIIIVGIFIYLVSGVAI